MDELLAPRPQHQTANLPSLQPALILKSETENLYRPPGAAVFLSD